MYSRLLVNLFLLLLVIALGIFLFNDETQQDAVTKLSDIPVKTINQISIKHNQRELVLLKKNEWRLIKPVEISANQFRIKTLLSMLNTKSYAKYKTDELDLKEHGLDRPTTSIRFNDMQIDFGIVNPINNYRYVKTGGQLHLIDDHFYPLLSSQIGTLIATELLPANKKIRKLILPNFTFTRNENGTWETDDDISSDSIVETIYQWQHKQAFAVHDYMERESLGDIQIFFENNNAAIQFSITDIDPWLIIARPDIKLEYHFNIEDYNALLNPGAPTTTTEDSQDKPGTETLRVSPDEFLDAIQPQ